VAYFQVERPGVPCSTPPPERFATKYEVDEATGCWVWNSGFDGSGYGRFHEKPRSPAWRAHRYSYFLEHGSVPPCLDHICRNIKCVNPSHLRPLDQVENVMIGESPIAKNARKTHCSRGHEFNTENTRIETTKKGRGIARRCVICMRMHGRVGDAKRRARRKAQREQCQTS
jgi:hypothetical protein